MISKLKIYIETYQSTRWVCVCMRACETNFSFGILAFKMPSKVFHKYRRKQAACLKHQISIFPLNMQIDCLLVISYKTILKERSIISNHRIYKNSRQTVQYT